MNIKSRKSNNIYKGLIAALERKDSAIRNFAHITSHELRAPVASMLGLMQLWEVHQHDEQFSKLLINKMRTCAIELNEVANRLNTELDANNNILNPGIVKHQC